jgi:hypothetical protein
MEIWNPVDGSVQLLFKEIPPERGQATGTHFINIVVENSTRNPKIKVSDPTAGTRER